MLQKKGIFKYLSIYFVFLIDWTFFPFVKKGIIFWKFTNNVFVYEPL